MNDTHTIQLVDDEAEVQGFDATSYAVFVTVAEAANKEYQRLESFRVNEQEALHPGTMHLNWK
jgi:hypothetical protein